jgi:shikimate kinase
MIILIGFMGVGKTSVGKALRQEKMGRFCDLDDVIRDQHGDIASIFDTVGDVGFRHLEYTALKGVLADASIGVVSTGGGIITHEPSFALLKKQSNIVWLKAQFLTVESRIHGDVKSVRPLADAQLKQRFMDRQSLYQSLATCTICVDDISPKDVAEIIINRYR